MYYIVICDDDASFTSEFCKKLTEVLSLKKVDAQLARAIDIFLKKRQPSQILLNLSGELLSLNIAGILYIEVYGRKSSGYACHSQSFFPFIPAGRD